MRQSCAGGIAVPERETEERERESFVWLFSWPRRTLPRDRETGLLSAPSSGCSFFFCGHLEKHTGCCCWPAGLASANVDRGGAVRSVFFPSDPRMPSSCLSVSVVSYPLPEGLS